MAAHTTAPAPSIVSFILPDFSKCNGSAIGPGLNTALAFFKSDFGNNTPTGSRAFKQPLFGCFDNVPLCVGVCCVPCCGSAVNAHNMSLMTGRTCEDECLLSCVLQCCCFYPCYHASVRGEFRKKYDLEGSHMMDCVLGLCFGSCMVCQEGMELQHNEEVYKIPMCTVDDAAIANAKINAKTNKDGNAGKTMAAPQPITAVVEPEKGVVVPPTAVAAAPHHTEPAGVVVAGGLDSAHVQLADK